MTSKHNYDHTAILYEVQFLTTMLHKTNECMKCDLNYPTQLIITQNQILGMGVGNKAVPLK
jgi:hypothetical protein